MDTYFVAGRADDAAYAHAEILADKLQRLLPGISIVKYPMLASEWPAYLEDTCRTKGFLAYNRSPLVWSSAERLVGDEKDFAELARERYNIELEAHLTEPSMLAQIAAENLAECQRDRNLRTEPKAKLYVSAFSTACFGPWLLLVQSNTLHEAVVLDLTKHEHKTPHFMQLNQLHTVPTLVDKDGTTLWESNAIMRYLVGAYELSDRFYPADLRRRATVDQALDFRQMVLLPCVSALTDFPLGFAPAPNPEAAKHAMHNLKKALVLLEKELIAWNSFVGGDEPTIADYAIVPLLGLLVVTDAVLPPSIKAYMARFEAETPAFAHLKARGMAHMLTECTPAVPD